MIEKVNLFIKLFSAKESFKFNLYITFLMEATFFMEKTAKENVTSFIKGKEKTGLLCNIDDIKEENFVIPFILDKDKIKKRVPSITTNNNNKIYALKNDSFGIKYEKGNTKIEIF